MMNFSVQPAMQHVYRFCEDHPEAPVDAYLVVGERAALMIDALETATGVWEEVRRITELPVSLAVTHGHCDHAGAALQEFLDAGCTVYMDPADVEPLRQTTGQAWNAEVFAAFPPAFDLGGIVLEVLGLPGHTEGSKVFLDRERQLMFTGDAAGSGDFWMQLGHSMPMHVFCHHLREVLEKTADLPELALLPGHAYQMPRPLGRFYLTDVLRACENVIAGQDGQEDQIMYLGDEKLVYRTAGYGSLRCMCYNPYRL